MGQKYQTKVRERVSYSVSTNESGRREEMGVGLTLKMIESGVRSGTIWVRMAAKVLALGK